METVAELIDALRALPVQQAKPIVFAGDLGEFEIIGVGAAVDGAGDCAVITVIERD